MTALMGIGILSQISAGLVHRNGSGKHCGVQSSSPNQGWVSVTKPSVGRRKDQVVDWRINLNGEDGTCYSTNDRISLLTPVEGTTVRDLKAKGKGVLGVNFLETQFDRFNPPDEYLNPWLSQKVRQCGEVVGITVDNNKGGWESLLAFAHDRDRENWEVLVADRSKRKGSRELQSLACLINYERTYNRFKEVQCSTRIDKRKKGSVKSCL